MKISPKYHLVLQTQKKNDKIEIEINYLRKKI